MSPIAGPQEPLLQTALTWCQEADTQAWAEALATRLQPDPARPEASWVIELQGQLGAGKTTLVRHLLRALGASGRIKSPSYAIVEPYELPGLNAWHFDFYRFGDPREWEDAGFRELFGAPGLKLIEWPDKLRTMLPVPDLRCCLTLHLDGCRTVTIEAWTAIGTALLSAIPTLEGPLT